MYLSKLEIIGFKSFAQKTLLKFDAGMTSIVGPNGCGKTNVVDAIRWALGEQKAGTLRSDVMENVIFNGTRTRKPLGMAEVSLTIENTKGILPTEYSEVTITRRLFRSGESEYLLNKTQCRLKDIVELFMDTGMGANAYSVIELKMIETILSDRTEERRKLFEEAAGVTKYKARRKEALRRLDQVSADLERVDDIVKEVTKTVGSLERQAEKAQKHAELTAQLRALEIDLLEREYVSTWEKLEPLRTRLVETENNKTRITDELAKYESMLDVIEREEDEIDELLASSERGVKEKSDILSRTRETIIATEERVLSLQGQAERAIVERDRLEMEQAELAIRLDQLSASLTTAISERDELEEEKKQREQIRADAEQVVQDRRNELQRARDIVYALINQRNKRSNELERGRARIEELENRINRFTQDHESLDGRKSDIESRNAPLTDERNAAKENVNAAERAMQSAQEEKDRLKLRMDELQNESFALQNEIGKTLSKIEFFTGLVEQGIGAGEGTEFLLSQHGWSSHEAVTVADAMTTAPDLRAAFESALGEVAHYLIVPNSKDAFEAVEMLRHSQKGKATFICLDRVPSQTDMHFGLPDGAFTALSASQFNVQYSDLFRMLLGGIVIVTNIQDAFAILDSTPQVEKCVTRDGEVITREGFVRGGSKRKTEGILIGKREQIGELETETANLKAKLDALEAEIGQMNRTFDGIVMRDFNNKVRSAEEALRAVDSKINQSEYELRRLTEERTRLYAEEERTRVELAPIAESLAAIQPDLDRLEEEHTASHEQSARAQLLVEEAERILAAEIERSTQVQVKYAALSGEVTRYESEKRQTEQSIAVAARTEQERIQERERVEREIGEFSAKLDEFRGMLSQIDEELRAMTSQRDEVSERRKDKQAEAHKYREALREERAEHDKTLNISHELALKIQEFESKIVAIEQRAREEFELLEIERKIYAEDDTFSFGDKREEVREIKQKVKNLGAVNLLAYEEFTKERDRMQFLVEQRKDLAEAQKNLVQTIEEINDTATRQFLETFEKIRGHFQDIFRSLFGDGDECDLNLEEGKDPLEAQIEIIAKPRGKRPHSIDLLSGGEKTMTAIALLFAIYLVKPSPFCILDEVDAPLDDSNIDRFLQIIRRFAVDTQFIVVTHNKRTMAAADALYGVTQEEDGISKIVSVRLKRDLFTAAQQGQKKAESLQAENVEEALA
ncbi:MAG: chromosome segregation protein SMC [Candidatus Kapaibacterium sp.]|jgi:chromosome segregation protein